MTRRCRIAPVLLVASAVLAGSTRARGAAGDTSGGFEWRPFGGAAFREARDKDRAVFLVLTAPWNRDHFVLLDRIFSDEEVVARLARDYVAVRADATVFPELRRRYSIRSGLVPSFHFLDARGRPHASFPPSGSEELSFFLDEMAGVRGAAAPRGPEEVTYEINARKLANRIARLLLGRLARGEWRLAPLHRDLDPGALVFLVEYGATRPHRRDIAARIRAELATLLGGPLHDRVDGGFHRAMADSERGIVHYEKLLRPNAALGGALSSWFRMSKDEAIGAAALRTLACLNERMRARRTTLYAGSLAADVYDPTQQRLQLDGRSFYRMNAEGRRRYDDPPRSTEIPVGANFVLHQALVDYVRAFHDVRMMRAVERGGRLLLESGFKPEGAARRTLDLPGPGNLRDQGDAGSGLLAYHAVSGDPRGLAAARAVGEVLVRDFWDAERSAFRDVSRRADLPGFLEEGEGDPGWNGVVLRFLAELGTVTGEERWRTLARESLHAWAARIPADGRGIGELGRAALRLEDPLPLILVDAPPSGEAGTELRDLAFRLFDPLLTVRWIDPRRRGREGRRFGIETDRRPALHLAWDGVAGPIREAPSLERAFEAARRRVRTGRE